MNIWLTLLALAIGLGLGVFVMAVVYLGSRADECATCPTACAWSYVRGGLAAKGWQCITPQLIIDLAPDCRHSCGGKNPVNPASPGGSDAH